MPFEMEGHKTAQGSGYYYSNHYTPEELLERIVRELELGMAFEATQSSYERQFGSELKITITVERTG